MNRLERQALVKRFAESLERDEKSRIIGEREAKAAGVRFATYERSL